MNPEKYTTEDRGTASRSPILGLLNRNKKPKKLDEYELAATCLEQESFAVAAIHLVNELAFYLQCDRVSIGMRSGKHIELSALSNSASFDRKSNLIRNIEAAMDESIDESSTIVYPNTNAMESTISVAHERLVKIQGNRTICTIPLSHRGHNFGALCFERSAEQILNTSDVQCVENILKLAGPILYLLHQEQRSFTRRIADSIHTFCTNIFGQDKTVSRAVGIGLLFVLILLTIFPANYRITADAVMEGSTQRIVAAPVAGYIATANKRAGDIVNIGDVIATIDDRDLKLEELKLESQRQQLQREYRESFATSDRSKISILDARIKQIDAKLELVSEQLSRLHLAAPIDGIIIEGDLNQAIGSPVTRGDILFKVAPVDDYRVILNVDESEISQIEYGQTGQLALSALPDEPIQISVSKITPVSISSDGRTFFRVEAKLDKVHKQLQPGMEGVGKIYVGERKLIWVLTHKAVDRLRLLLWHIWL